MPRNWKWKWNSKMDIQNILDHVKAYHESGETLNAARFLIRAYDLASDNLAGLDFQKDVPAGQILMTTVGNVPGTQTVNIPDGVFKYNFELVLNLLMHEMLHVRQKSPENPVLDKNEREFQAYYEMLYHKVFPRVPDAPITSRIAFAQKALEYYKRMGEGSDLQKKYLAEKDEVEEYLMNMQSIISANRNEKLA